MKTPTRYTLLIALVLVLTPMQAIIAQTSEPAKTVTVFELPSNCSEYIPSNTDTNLQNTFNEEDYPYLRNLQCLKNEQFLEDRGFTSTFKNMKSKNNNRFVLTGSGYKLDMTATYDKDGHLVNSLLTMRDIRIPRAIQQYIYSDKFEGWTMTGNEKIVKDFDPYQTEYKIIMTNGTEEKVLSFREYGNTFTLLQN
jgi:hypothetical protein